MRSTRRDRRLASVAGLVALLLAPAAHALDGAAAEALRFESEGTEACPPPQVALDPDRLVFDESGSGTFMVYVLNLASVRGDVGLRLEAPSGWSAFADAPHRSVEASGSDARATFAVHVTAPSRATGLMEGDLAAIVTLTCTLPDEPNEEARVLAWLPVSVDPGPGPWPFLVAAGGVVVAGIAAYGLVRRHRGAWHAVTRGSVRLDNTGSAEAPILLHNRGGAPVTLDLGVASLPEGWTAHLAASRVSLDPGEERQLWCTIHIGDAAEPPRRRERVRASRVFVRVKELREGSTGDRRLVRIAVRAPPPTAEKEG